MSNGQQLADHNVAVFKAWMASKSTSDYRRITHRGALSRSVIAKECGFAKSALAQNPRIRSLLHDLEVNLRATGVLPQLEITNSEAAESPPKILPTLRDERNGADTPPALEAKLQRLQTENALQRAEIEELRQQLKQFTSIHEALSNTGRMPR